MLKKSSPKEIEFLASSDPEAVFLKQLQALLADVTPSPASPTRDWQRQPFRPYLLGYTGKGNVGADIRVREVVRQMRSIFAHVGFDPLMAVMGETAIDPVLDALEKINLDGYLPDTLPAMMAEVDGVIACEGSMFTSKFSDLLSATFAVSLGYATRQGRLAVGYGAEAGIMTQRLSDMVSASCRGTLVLSRSAATHAHLSSLGLDSRLGADSAWTYAPSGEAIAKVQDRLRAHRWDGQAPIAVVCPMNPFCWPVKVDLEKAAAKQKNGRFADVHYEGVLFHAAQPNAAVALAGYLQSLKSVVSHLRGRGYFPVMVGMERLDGKTCARQAATLDRPIPVFVSGASSAETIVSVLHSASLVVSSRFHACVLSLNAQVKTIGIALDERIRNLYTENAMESYFFRSDSDALGERLVDAIDRIRDADMQDIYAELIRTQVRRFGTMGLELHDAALRICPGMQPSPLPRRWSAYLPPLPPRLEALIDGMD